VIVGVFSPAAADPIRPPLELSDAIDVGRYGLVEAYFGNEGQLIPELGAREFVCDGVDADKFLGGVGGEGGVNGGTSNSAIALIAGAAQFSEDTFSGSWMSEPAKIQSTDTRIPSQYSR